MNIFAIHSGSAFHLKMTAGYVCRECCKQAEQALLALFMKQIAWDMAYY